MRLSDRWIFAAVLLAGCAGRLWAIRDSMWLDESWVANSVLAPSVSRMLFYDQWAQSTPPLFLIFTRLWTGLFGHGELAMRTISWIAVAIGALVLMLILRRMFSTYVALFGSTVFAANYYVSKYGQQVKQYSTDLLAAILFLALAWLCLTSRKRNPSIALVTLAGIGCTFLSYTSVFWFPSLVLAILLMPSVPEEGPWKWPPMRRFVAASAVGGLLIASAGAAWLLFIRPNVVGRLVERQEDRFIGSGGVLPSLERFADNVSTLLFPHAGRLATAVSYCLLALVLFGIARAFVGSIKGRTRDRNLLVVAGVPLLVGMVLSLARQYPLLVYTRYVIWMLPSFVVFLMVALEIVWSGFERRFGSVLERPLARLGATAVCISAIAGLASIQAVRREPTENVRGAYELLQQQLNPNDVVYVAGGVTHQLKYYQTTRGWRAGQLYWGNLAWPCCPVNLDQQVTNIRVTSFDAELAELTRDRTRRVWLLLPGLEPGTWASGLRPVIMSAPDRMKTLGWSLVERHRFTGAVLFEFRAD